VREQALRCRHIVRGLANFGGHDSEVREPLDLHALCERVVRGFSLEPGAARIEIDAPADLPELLANRFALEQVVANLLSNALQASPANGLVRLALRSTPDALVLAVEDEGPGIPEAIRAHVFDPFFSTRTREHGMGLGLAIVHGVVQAHGGSVRAENRVPRGARLVVTLPLRPTPAKPPAAPLAEHVLEPRPRPPMDAGAPRPLELLVIEDEPRLCELFRSLGTIRGWRVVSAGSGADGLARLTAERARFDVILCDLRMPGPSGIEIHDRLRAEDPELLERFLFVTGDLGSDETALFARRCTRPIVRKPFEFSELGVEIETLAGARRIAEG
jgi:CheY-like chemotaxis protein/anti-sigma regulatory factor (Ser/Thr protein kinase)